MEQSLKIPPHEVRMPSGGPFKPRIFKRGGYWVSVVDADINSPEASTIAHFQYHCGSWADAIECVNRYWCSPLVERSIFSSEYGIIVGTVAETTYERIADYSILSIRATWGMRAEAN